MPIRFRVSLSGNGRSAAIGALAILALLVTSCNPIQEDIPQLVTPVAPPEAEETAAPAPPEMVTLEATVAVNALRVRQEADAESPIIAGMLQGDVIPVIGRTEDGSWLKVSVPDVETIGWIWAEDVTLEGDAAALLVSEDGGEMAEEAAAEETSADGQMAAETAAEGESDDDETAMEALEPSVTVHPQDVIKGTITIAEAVAQEKGWISVHADDAGSLGPIIGQASLEAGVTTGLTVRVVVDAATETLYAMLHIDGGVFDIFEFPGPDLPVLEEGEPISPAFRVTIGEMSMAEDDADEELRPEPTSTDPTPTELALLSQGDVTTQVAIIQSRALRVRSTPETISEVLAGVTAGEAYPVAGFSADQEWVAIFFYDIEDPVWVSTSLVELRELEFRVQMGRATVDLGVYGRLRLRGGPSLEAPVVGHVQSGESYSILGFSADGGWALLVGTEVKGPVWASASFLRLE